MLLTGFVCFSRITLALTMNKILGIVSSALLAVSGVIGGIEGAHAGTDTIKVSCGALGFSVSTQDVIRFAQSQDISEKGNAVLRSVSRFCGTSEQELRTVLNKQFSATDYAQVEQYANRFDSFVLDECDKKGEVCKTNEQVEVARQGKQALIRGAIAFVLFGDDSARLPQKTQFTVAETLVGLQRRGTPHVWVDVAKMVSALR